MAAAERGRKVLVRVGTTFEVGDHDFTIFSIIPLVSLFIDIPERIEVYVGIRTLLLNLHWF